MWADLDFAPTTGFCIRAGGWQGDTVTGSTKRVATKSLSLFDALSDECKV